jgi:hypothetical protein
MFQQEITWTAPEYEHRPKEVSWFWLSIIVAVLILGVAVWQKNFLFGFFVVVAEILIIVFGNREPRQVEFTVSDKGLTVDGRKFYAWSEIQSWSAKEPEDAEWGDIILNFRVPFRPDLRFLIPKSKFPDVKAVFAAKAAEVERQESFTDSLQRFLGF